MLDLVVTNWAWLVLALIVGGTAGYLSIRAHAGRRRAAEAKAAENARRAAEAKAAENAGRAAEPKAAEDARRAAEAKAAEKAGIATPQAQLLATAGETKHSTGVKSGTIKIDASADTPVVDAEMRKLGDSLPPEAPAVEGEGRYDGRRPYGLAAPRSRAPDDLKRIRGIGPQNEGRLHALGIWHFDQIAAWSAENTQWIGSYLAFRGRIERERWIDQAKELAAGRNTKFLPGANVHEIAMPKDRGRPAQG